uniref:PHD-type domain-containing protein n=1 Tax=Plectus sambesii TaxID=2011161 RepID=A0A914W0S7_9BILA
MAGSNHVGGEGEEREGSTESQQIGENVPNAIEGDKASKSTASGRRQKRARDKASKSTASGRRQKRARRKRKAAVDTGEDSENERLKQRFVKPLDRRQRRQEAADQVGPLLRKSTASDRMLLHNPSTHDRLVARAEETQANKIVAGSTKPVQGTEHEGPWRCALCQQGSGRDALGDLFGPYFTRIDDEHWPPFVKKPTKRKSKSAPDDFVDLWFHGDCALWTPALHLSGSALTDLEDCLGTHWAQTCTICSKEGATIVCGSSSLHFPCAMKKGYKLDRSVLSCTAPASQRPEKKKRMSI